MASSSTTRAHRSTKLRNSCNGCTMAKMACSKEKPACARCQRRGEVCVYAPTRRIGRPGRKEQKKAPERESTAISDAMATTDTAAAHSSSPPPPPPPPPSPPPSLAPSQARTGSKHHEEPAVMSIGHQFSEPPSTYHSTDLISRPDPSDIFSSIESSPMRTIAGDTSGDPVALFPTLSPAIPNDLATQLLNQDDVINFSYQDPGATTVDELFGVGGGKEGITLSLSSNDYLMYPSTILPQANTTVPTRPSNWFACSDSGSNSNAPTLAYSDPSHPDGRGIDFKQSLLGSRWHSLEAYSCAPRALALLDQLTPYIDSCTRTADGLASPSDQPPTFQEIMARNEAGINSVNQMLSCPCSEHFSLLHILFLIMSKILGWYAAASVSSLDCFPGTAIEVSDLSSSSSSSASSSRRPSCVVQPPSTSSLTTYIDDVDDQDKGRIVCQVVLSKLHNAQRVVNILSGRFLESERQKRPPTKTSNRLASITQDLISGGGVMSHQSSISGDRLARNLEADLRSRMRELSQAIVKTLERWT